MSNKKKLFSVCRQNVAVFLCCGKLLFAGNSDISKQPCQTGKYVVYIEDLPRASKLPCLQQPIKPADFEKYTISYGEEMQGRFSMCTNLMGKNIFRAQNIDFPIWQPHNWKSCPGGGGKTRFYSHFGGQKPYFPI